MASQMMIARRAFIYGGGVSAPVDLDFGQLVELAGERTDDKLIEYRHVVPAPRGVAVVGCGKCGAKFATDADLNRHGKKRHPDHEMSEYEKLVAMESEDRMVTTIAPLNIDRTVEVQTVKRGRPKKNN